VLFRSVGFAEDLPKSPAAIAETSPEVPIADSDERFSRGMKLFTSLKRVPAPKKH
jgi:hypothetical protein